MCLWTSLLLGFSVFDKSPAEVPINHPSLQSCNFRLECLHSLELPHVRGVAVIRNLSSNPYKTSQTLQFVICNAACNIFSTLMWSRGAYVVDSSHIWNLIVHIFYAPKIHGQQKTWARSRMYENWSQKNVKGPVFTGFHSIPPHCHRCDGPKLCSVHVAHDLRWNSSVSHSKGAGKKTRLLVWHIRVIQSSGTPNDYGLDIPKIIII